MPEEQNFYCPECGVKLKPGEINRINSGIDIACQVCGTEIIGTERIISDEDVKSESASDDIGKKIKKGIQSFVKGIKSFAKSFEGNEDQNSSNNYSDE